MYTSRRAHPIQRKQATVPAGSVRRTRAGERCGLVVDANCWGRCPDEGYAEIARRRSHAMPAPPARTISTIHKAKGLECDNAVLIAGDRDQFSGTQYARCKLYVALSRAKRSLTIVISQNNPTPLFNAA